jgi:hypothetical protein
MSAADMGAPFFEGVLALGMNFPFVYRTTYGKTLSQNIAGRFGMCKEKMYSTPVAHLRVVCYIMGMKRISVFLTIKQIAGLKDWSQTTGLRFGELLRRILDKALEEHLKQE